MTKNYFLIGSAAALAVMAMSSIAHAEINLCSGNGNGVYYEAADAIKAAAGRTVMITNVETVGTGENIQFTVNGVEDESCDAFIGQPDAVVYEAKAVPVISKIIRPVGTLHREYLHAICNKESGVDDVGDLESDPKKYSIAIGDVGSGAWYTWQNMITEDDDYSEVQTVAEGGALAAASVASGTATCMLVPAGLSNGTVNNIDATYSDTVALVGVNDRDFDDAVDIKGKPLYEYRDIDGVYKNMQCGSWSCDEVSTISWPATVFINTKKLTDKKELEAFINAVGKAGLNMKAKYGK